MPHDNAPIRPTCPIIDNIIDKLNTAKDEADYIYNHPKEDSVEEAGEILAYIGGIVKDMEKIRKDNTRLRKWGNEQYKRAEELEEDILRVRTDKGLVF